MAYRLYSMRCKGFRKDGTACRSLLFKGRFTEGKIEIKCGKCGTVNQIVSPQPTESKEPKPKG